MKPKRDKAGPAIAAERLPRPPFQTPPATPARKTRSRVDKFAGGLLVPFYDPERDALEERIAEWRPIVERMEQLQAWADSAAMAAKALADAKPDDPIRAERARLLAEVAERVRGDVVFAGREAERKAWARFVAASVDMAAAQMIIAVGPAQETVGVYRRSEVELEAAIADLAECGVDAHRYLEETWATRCLGKRRQRRCGWPGRP